jgi:hypothetical protein
MQAPARDPSDFYIALRAKSTLFMPEIAKSAGTPKRFQHVSPFAFFEVGFIGWIIRVRFAFHLDMSFDGNALGVESQSLFGRPSSSQVSTICVQLVYKKAGLKGLKMDLSNAESTTDS